MGMIEIRERRIEEIEDQLALPDLPESERKKLEADKKNLEAMNEDARNLRDIVDFL